MKIDLENLSSDECNEKSIASVVEYSLSRLGIHPDSEISIRFVGEVEMTDLHLKWMQLDGPTDVLSFPMDEMKPNSVANGPGVVGDIVLCPTYAAKNGKQTVERELELLAVHGVLHLLGYDHEEIEDEVEMFSLQEKLLGEWRALK